MKFVLLEKIGDILNLCKSDLSEAEARQILMKSRKDHPQKHYLMEEQWVWEQRVHL